MGSEISDMSEFSGYFDTGFRLAQVIRRGQMWGRLVRLYEYMNIMYSLIKFG